MAQVSGQNRQGLLRAISPGFDLIEGVYGEAMTQAMRQRFSESDVADNLFGLTEPFSGKTEYLDKLIGKDDCVELTLSYSKGPFRQAYRVYSVSRQPAYGNVGKAVSLPGGYFRASQY